MKTPLDPQDPNRRAMLDQMDPPDPTLGQPGKRGPNTAVDRATAAGPQFYSPAPTDQTLSPSPSPNTGIAGAGSPTSPVAPTAPAAAPTPYDHSTFRDAWLGTGNNVGAQDALLQQYGISLGANGAGMTPDGMMDLRRGAKAGDNTAQWMGIGGGGGQGSSGGGGSLAQGMSFNTGGAGGSLDQTYRDTLLKMMQGYDQPINDQTPGIAQPYAAADLASQRGMQQERKALAEREYATGGGTPDQAAITQGVQQSAERNAVGMAGIKSDLYTHEIDAQRQQLSHALDLANAVGARTEAAQLQMQLAQLDQQYRYAALGQNQGQFEDNMAFNWSDWLQRQKRDALLGGMNG